MGAPLKNSEALRKKYNIKNYRHIYNQAYSENEINFLAKELLKWTKKSVKNNRFEKFFTPKGIGPQRITEFCQKNKYFKHVHELCKEMFLIRTEEMGMNKKYATNFMKLVMINRFGWTDSQKIQHSGEVIEKIQYVPVKTVKK